MCDEDVAALVCDNGSGMCKAGFAGDDAPNLKNIFISNKNYLIKLQFLVIIFIFFELNFKKIYLFHKNILIKYYLTCSVIILNSRISAKVAKFLKSFLRREDPMKL